MSIFVRIVALFLSLVVIAVPILVALLVASVEPSRPVQVSWVAPYALGSLASALGYLGVALIPKRLAVAALHFRLFIALLMSVPIAVAVYLLFVTGSAAVVALCLALLIATAWLLSACVWPAWLAGSNPAFERDAPKAARPSI